MFANVDQLEEFLSRPCTKDVEFVRQLHGDILILGAGGKMGPTLAMRIRRALEQVRVASRVIAVARYSDKNVRERLERSGVETVRADLLDANALAGLPDAPNVIFMAAMKFGTTGAEHMTWAMNTFLPGLVAERFPRARITAFSTGNLYPLVPVASGGATEQTLTAPVGEYAQSALGRERMFEYGSIKYGTPVTLLRLNYATEMRYGVLVDIGRKVYTSDPVDLAMGYANVIWQGDANSVCLRSLALCSSPPFVLNVTGPEVISVRNVAKEFGRLFGKEPRFQGQEADTALLSNSARMTSLLGPPQVSLADMIAWTAGWIAAGGVSHGRPTHFETRDGRF